MLHNKEILKDRRRELRRNETKEEKILWSKVRGGKLGVKFKRQHSIGGYILDFYCPEYKLIIELDGGVHNKVEAREYDKIRDTYFRELGYRTIRFLNSEVENKIEKVLIKIRNYLCEG